MTEEDVVNKLQFSKKTNRTLGARKDAWCEFYQVHDHDTKRCLTMKYQLAKLVKEGFLAKYLRDPKTDYKDESQAREHNHKTPLLGDFNTITSGFSQGGSLMSGWKRYSRSVLSLETRASPTVPSLCFTPAYLEDVCPHEDGPMVLSVITMGHNVHRVFIDQRSSTGVMF